MKHLLTALIATLVLVLPLHADEPTQTISVRVIDHEGSPIGGLALKAKVGSVRAKSVTDSSGLATFSVQVQPDADSVWIWPFDSSFELVSLHGAATDQPEPDPVAFSSYAFDRVTQFDLEDFAGGPVTIRAPQTVRSEVRLYVSGFSAAGPVGYALQRRGGAQYSWSRPGSGRIYDVDEGGSFLRSSVPLVQGRASLVALYAQGRYHIVELDAVKTNSENLMIEVPDPESLVSQGKIRSPVVDQAVRIRFCLIAVDGGYAREVQLTPEKGSSVSGRGHILRASARVPSGEFYIDSREQRLGSGPYDACGPNLWSPNSVFDTMLRLRRGEDLPHLKRITITEGETVEISPDDYTLPPTNDQPADQPQPANPR
ncbi:MAG: hypothetical protein ACF8MJ_02360 [Phycisphaerales bacterium JB050]